MQRSLQRQVPTQVQMTALAGRGGEVGEVAEAAGRLVGDQGLEVAGDLGAGPVLGGDEFAAQDTLFVDHVALGDLAGAVEGLDVGGGITEGEEVDVVLLEEAVVLVGVLVLTDGYDGDLGELVLEGQEAGELLDAGRAPGGPEVDDDDVAAELAEVDGVRSFGEGELGGGFADVAGVVAAVAAGGQEEGEAEGREDGAG